MSLRDEQRELTQRKILTAVLDLVADGSLDELSVPAVAQRSGVSPATIYRYFPTKGELIAAAAQEPSRAALEAARAAPPRPGDDELATFQRAMWTSFAGNLALLRHQVASQAGREMRSARTERSSALVGAYVERHGIDPASPEGARLVAIVLLLSGSLGLVELHDRQGLAVDDALAASQWAVHALIDASRPHRRTSRSTP